MTNRVRAAGGVPWRRGNDGEIEVLVVYRPRYRDWTFPKGKLQPGESDEQAALREVEEETSLRCRLGRELPGTTYIDRRGRPKVVRYWAMRPVVGEAVAQNEVGKVAWLTLERAADLLSYERDVGVLESLRRRL